MAATTPFGAYPTVTPYDPPTRGVVKAPEPRPRNRRERRAAKKRRD